MKHNIAWYIGAAIGLPVGLFVGGLIVQGLRRIDKQLSAWFIPAQKGE